MNASLLKKTFLFKDFGDAELNRLAAVAKEEQQPAETELFAEGESGNRFYVIVMGSVVVKKRNSEGVDQELVTLSSGSCFGEMALVDESHERTATIITREASTLLVFSQPDILKLMNSDDKLAHHFYKALARGLSARLRSTTKDASFYKALAVNRRS